MSPTSTLPNAGDGRGLEAIKYKFVSGKLKENVPTWFLASQPPNYKRCPWTSPEYFIFEAPQGLALKHQDLIIILLKIRQSDVFKN